MKFHRSIAWMLLLLGVFTLRFALADSALAQSPPPASPFGLLPGEFAIRTVKGTYLTARDGGRHSIDAVITSATTLGLNEKFKLSRLSPNFTTIQTLQGYYVSAVGGGGLGGSFAASQVLQTERTSLANDALFKLSGPYAGDFTTIRTFNDHYLHGIGRRWQDNERLSY